MVTGFDDETKEEELIAHFYRLVYGGGTRNINDGKVKACHIVSLKIDQPATEMERDAMSPHTEMKVALVTFENKVLADLALSNSLTSLFRDMPLFTEAPNEHS